MQHTSSTVSRLAKNRIYVFCETEFKSLEAFGHLLFCHFGVDTEGVNGVTFSLDLIHDITSNMETLNDTFWGSFSLLNLILSCKSSSRFWSSLALEAELDRFIFLVGCRRLLLPQPSNKYYSAVSFLYKSPALTLVFTRNRSHLCFIFEPRAIFFPQVNNKKISKQKKTE